MASNLDTSKLDMDAVIDAAMTDEGEGFCLACGASRMECEPDARGYDCDECGKPMVYGAAEIMLTVAIA